MLFTNKCTNNGTSASLRISGDTWLMPGISGVTWLMPGIIGVTWLMSFFVLIPYTQVDMEEKLKLEVKGRQKKMVKRTYIPYMV